jgi:toxin ParE1/3/4
MVPVRVLEAATAEAAEAAAWYEARRTGLGGEFRLELKRMFDTLADRRAPGSPWPGRLGERGVRRVGMRRYPFYVVFVAFRGEYVVLAVAHHRRRPAYWQNRVPSAEKSAQ